MALNLLRVTGRQMAAVRTSLVAVITTSSSMSTRAVLSHAVKPLSSSSQFLAITTNNSLNRRFYSSDNKLDKSKIEEKVLDILRNFDRIKENPDKPKVTLESHLMKDLGLDSLDQVEVIVQLEDAFGYEIPDSDYEKLLTPVAIVNYIQSRLAQV